METNDDLAPGWALERKANPFKWPSPKTILVCAALVLPGLALSVASLLT